MADDYEPDDPTAFRIRMVIALSSHELSERGHGSSAHGDESAPRRDEGSRSSSLLLVCRAPASRCYLLAGVQRAWPSGFAGLAGEK
jgi:hypothetical protein